MTVPACSASARWYRDGHCGYRVRTMKSAGRMLDLLQFERPAGAMSRSGLPDLVLVEDMLGGSRIRASVGGRRFDVMSKKGALYLGAPSPIDYLRAVRGPVHRVSVPMLATPQ